MNINIRLLILTSLGLITFGFMILYSSSYMLGLEWHNDGFFYLKKQAVALVLGSMLALLASQIPSHVYQKLSPSLFIAGIVVILMTFIPHVGASGGGASRWLQIGVLRFQPGELAKIIFVLILGASCAKIEKPEIKMYLKKLILPFMLAFLLVLQPDFGGFMVCMLVACILIFCSHFPIKYFLGFFLSLGITAYVLIEQMPYRKARILSFMNPWGNENAGGFQIIQSLLGFRAGGMFGVGLGNSQEKLMFLPAAHNDFVLAIIGEELGFIGVIGLLGSFLLFIFTGFSLARKIEDPYRKNIVLGLSSLVGIQALLHFGVNLGVLPTKGLNLPFISYGGTSLIATCCIVGIIYAMVKNGEKV